MQVFCTKHGIACVAACPNPPGISAAPTCGAIAGWISAPRAFFDSSSTTATSTCGAIAGWISAYAATSTRGAIARKRV